MVYNGGKTFKQALFTSVLMLLGTFLAAYSLEVFLLPNQIIDGGVVGISILIADFIGNQWLYPLVILLNFPFLYLAFKSVGKSLVVQMFVSLVSFGLFGSWIESSHLPMFMPFRGDVLEIVVIGGLLLGLGLGMVIRWGGCVDGTEILGILLNRKYGFTVGSVVLAANTLIFSASGFVYGDWHPAIQSLITFFIVIKVMDNVIMGIDEMKAVVIMSRKPQEVAHELMEHLGLGLTVIHGKGGYSGQKQEILYLVAERLQLAEIKSIVHAIDETAFVAIENLAEVSTSYHPRRISSKRQPNKKSSFAVS